MTLRRALLLSVVLTLLIGVRVSSAERATAPRLDWTKKTLSHVRLPIRFVRRNARLYLECVRAAKAVGYPVPCPTMVPYGLSGTAITAGPCKGYRFQLVGTPCPAAGSAWRDWVVGSIQGGTGTSFEHLVIQVSPRPVDYRHALDGPVPENSRGPAVGSLITVDGRVMRWLFVSPTSDAGSAFMGHVVLEWTEQGHTYALGFHAVQGLKTAAALDYAFARHLELVTGG